MIPFWQESNLLVQISLVYDIAVVVDKVKVVDLLHRIDGRIVLFSFNVGSGGREVHADTEICGLILGV